jgi:hypothetical protein
MSVSITRFIGDYHHLDFYPSCRASSFFLRRSATSSPHPLHKKKMDYLPFAHSATWRKGQTALITASFTKP